jgi:putative transport protein
MGRMKRGGETRLAVGGAALDAGDLVTLVGTGDALRGATAILGELSEERLDLDRRILDFRRMFVSNPAVTEKPLVSLRLPERFGAIVTRLRRGDVELLPEADSIL